ncbi:MAG: HAD family hydrolase [Sandaracinaceae bacterium]|nr:HAD family hydrolase [Sandaracinaceae bacterium]
MSTIAAFFDLDGTLLAANSARIWFERERGRGALRRRDALRALAFLSAYKLGIVDVRRGLDMAAQALRDRDERGLEEEMSAFYLERITPLRAPGAFDAIRSHQAEGHRTVLLTTAPDYLAAAAMEDFRLDARIATRFEVAAGRFTGRLLHPVPYHRGKVVLAERFAERHGIDLAKSFFYSDSVTDLPMLRRVGNPRVVNPDPRLRRIVQREALPLLDWGRPESLLDETLGRKIFALIR